MGEWVVGFVLTMPLLVFLGPKKNEHWFLKRDA
jgi:hypothetical protein